MKKAFYLRRGLAALVLGALLAVTGPAHAATVGEPAPAFTATDATGATVSLSDFAGKVVVLEWFNKDCPFVRKHYDSKNMQGLQKEMTASGVVWLIVNSSAEGQQGYETPAEALATLAREEAAPTHYLMDAKGEIGHAYGARTTPHMYVVDAEGVLRYAGAIDDKPSTYASDIDGAENYVRTAVAAILAGEKVTTPTTKSYGCGVKYAH